MNNRSPYKFKVTINQQEYYITNDEQKYTFYRLIREQKANYKSALKKLAEIKANYKLPSSHNINLVISEINEQLIAANTNINTLDTWYASQKTKIDEIIPQIKNLINKLKSTPTDITYHQVNTMIDTENIVLNSFTQELNIINDIETLQNHLSHLKQQISNESKFNQDYYYLTSQKKVLLSHLNTVEDIKKKLDSIGLELEAKISFSECSYVEVNKIASGLSYHNLEKNEIEKLLTHCNWKQTNLSIPNVVELLVKFNKIIKNTPHLNYAETFNKFLQQHAIPIENEIALQNIEKLRFLDSLSRFVNDYLRYYLKNGFNSVITATIWNNQILFASNDTISESSKNLFLRDIEQAIKHLINIIDNCQTDQLNEQKNYIENILFNNEFPYYLPFNAYFSQRFCADLLNILQFQSNQKIFVPNQLLSNQLKINNNIYLQHVSSKNKILPAGIILLTKIVCNYLITPCLKDQTLSLLPKDAILIGSSKLDCAHEHQLIKLLNETLNLNIITTGTHWINYNSKEENIIKKFFDGLSIELNDRKKLIPSNNYQKICQFLTNIATLLTEKIKVSDPIFSHIKDFDLRNNKPIHPILNINVANLTYSAVSPNSASHFFKEKRSNLEEAGNNNKKQRYEPKIP